MKVANAKGANLGDIDGLVWRRNTLYAFGDMDVDACVYQMFVRATNPEKILAMLEDLDTDRNLSNENNSRRTHANN